METDTRVKMSNELARAGFQMTEWEHRIVNSAASKIRKSDSIDELSGRPHLIYVAEMTDLLDDTPKDLYRSVRKACNRLYERSIDFTYTSDRGSKIEQRTRWVTAIQFNSDQLAVAIKWNPDVLPYLAELGEQFTQYELAEVVKLTGKWSPRLYQILMSFRKTGFVRVKIDDLRLQLGLGNAHNTVGVFNREVIKPAVAQIVKKMPEMGLKYTLKKVGSRATHVEFSFATSVIPNAKGDAHLQEALPIDTEVITRGGAEKPAKAGSGGGLTKARAPQEPISAHKAANHTSKGTKGHTGAREGVRAALRDIGDTNW